MTETFHEVVDIIDEQGSLAIRLDANAPAVHIGGDPADRPGGVLVLRNTTGHHAIQLDANIPAIRIGLHGYAGVLSIIGDQDLELLQFRAENAELRLGAVAGKRGLLGLRDDAGREAILINGGNAALTLGTTGNPGDLIVQDAANRVVLQFEAIGGVLHVGAEGRPGEFKVHDASNRSSVQAIGTPAQLAVGTTDNPGVFTIQDAANRTVLRFIANDASLSLGTTGNGGDLNVQDSSNRRALQFAADTALLRLGVAGNPGDIALIDNAGRESIQLNGATGRITSRNADLAEQFDVAEAADAAPGTVMALASDGRLVPAAAAYDPAVVGVVAGGGRFRSGIILDHDAAAAGRRVAIAMVGKAACRVDARHGPVRVGDLLTSSPTPGCAMRAADPALAFGTVIGKALTPLDEGTGLVEMIISLQ
jgi:hypothetical protein